MKKVFLLFFTMFLLFIFPFTLYSEWKLVDLTRYIGGGSSIDCADELNCIVVTNYAMSSFLRKTTDGGLTWSMYFSDTLNFDDPEPKFNLNGMDKINYLTPTFAVTANHYGEIGITRDGGSTWETIQLKLAYESIDKWSGLSFYDSLNGVANTFNQIFITKDGGRTWRDTLITFDSVPDFNLRNIQMLDESTIYSSQSSNFIKSTNGGETWEHKTINGWPDIFRFHSGMHFINKEKGWITAYRRLVQGESGFNQVILQTDNGGETWTVQLDTIENVGMLLGIYFADENEGIAWGQGCQLWRTVDGGKNWIKGPEGSQSTTQPMRLFTSSFTGLAFPNRNTKKILTCDVLYGEIWMYDETLSVKESFDTGQLLYKLNAEQIVDVLRVFLESYTSTNAKIVIYDLNGNFVNESFHSISKGMNQINYNLNDLKSGVYLYHIIVDGLLLKSDKILIVK